MANRLSLSLYDWKQLEDLPLSQCKKVLFGVCCIIFDDEDPNTGSRKLDQMSQEIAKRSEYFMSVHKMYVAKGHAFDEHNKEEKNSDDDTGELL